MSRGILEFPAETEGSHELAISKCKIDYRLKYFNNNVFKI
jgi:hypothetical protein